MTNKQNERNDQGRWQNRKANEENEMVLDKNNKKVLTIRSNGLTQTDRDYFNIVKTEDGVSDFFRVDRNQEKIRLRKRENNFLYHSVRGEEGEKVAAIYLPNVT